MRADVEMDRSHRRAGRQGADPWGRALDPDPPAAGAPASPAGAAERGPASTEVWEHAFTASRRPARGVRRTDRRAVLPGGRAVRGRAAAPARRVALVPPHLHARRGARRRSGAAALRGGRPDLHGVGQRREVGSHTGGYLPFTLDVTDQLPPAGRRTLLEVRVRDLSETGVHARGKQRLDRGTIWYTAQSGIWQTVWLEPVPAAYVERLVLHPAPGHGALEVTVVVGGFADAATAQRRGSSSTSGIDEVGARVGRARAMPVARDPAVRGAAVVARGPASSTTSRCRLARTGSRRTPRLRSFGVGRDERRRTPAAPQRRAGGSTWACSTRATGPTACSRPRATTAMVHDIETMKSSASPRCAST